MFRTRRLSTRALVAATTAVVTLLTSSLVAWAQSEPRSGPEPAPETARYIVVLKDSVRSPRRVARRHANQLDAEIDAVYSDALKAYTADLTAAEVERLRAEDSVAYVEPDRMLHITEADPTVPTGVQRILAPNNPNLDLDGQDDVRIDVDVAVVDTGIAEHPDLQVVSRVDCTEGTCVEGGNDPNGHGTHVAGTVAALDNGTGVVGVAPGARLHSVTVCGPTGSCPTSAIVAGINHVTAQASTIEVVNMSLGGPGTSPAISEAITNSVNAGVVYSVAAGNSNMDAAGFFPASHPDVITVSAMADADGRPGGLGGNTACRASPDDARAGFSNFGPTVEVTAPGVCILSTWNNGGLNTISGTSMAAPHVTGAAAVLTSGPRDPTDRDTALAVRQQVVESGNLDWNDDSSDGVKEPLLDVGNATLYPPPARTGSAPLLASNLTARTG